MGEIIALTTPNGKEAEKAKDIRCSKRSSFNSFRKLVGYLFRKGSSDLYSPCPTVVILGSSNKKRSKSKLDSLSFDDKELLLKYYFNHLNILVLDVAYLDDSKVVSDLNEVLDRIHNLLKCRIQRIRTCTGTGESLLNDFFSRRSRDGKFEFQIEEIVSTMPYVLRINLNKSEATCSQIQTLNDIITDEIDFKSLLSDSSPEHLSKLSNLIGYWSFPAHDLTNDDLVYCAYLILKFAFDRLQESEEFSKCFNSKVLTPNEMLGLVFMVRDTYKGENPFHNFRHAVDVLQACFQYLVRLNYIPSFEQFVQDHTKEVPGLDQDGGFVPEMELVRTSHPFPGETNQRVLNLLHCFGILMAALGHDVGHPGVTNAFLVKYSSSISLTYNERSVLESYHASVFINKVLAISWPCLLGVKCDNEGKHNLREFITSCILATDMAVHFEYIKQIQEFSETLSVNDFSNVQLVSNLLIKCADISNVTRPLKISSQWALALNREFQEISLVEKQISLADCNPQIQSSYPKIPSTVQDILVMDPSLHKGQIFFINEFAENLFRRVTDLLHGLKYTYIMIEENKKFWLDRNAS